MVAQFLYVPGCMIISFDDSNTKTSSMHLVRVYDPESELAERRNQGIDLGKLEEVHTLYKVSEVCSCCAERSRALSTMLWA